MKSTAGTDAFVHDPLNLSSESIRVIKILSGKTGSIIKCKISHVPLTNTHVCLSYVWGRETDTEDILLNSKSFKVRQNLWHFLHQARKMGIKDNIWIDAICINQNHLEEKNHQVRQMAKIYRQARRVLAWLGCGSSEMEAALRLLGQLGLSGKSFQRAEALLKIGELPYWERLWIVQELLLASDVQLLYGDVRVPLYHVRGIMLNEPTLPDDPKILRVCDQASSAGQLQNYSLSRFMHKFGDFKCFDLRDRVYGLLGLLETSEPLRIDYGESCVSLFWRVISQHVHGFGTDEATQDLQRALHVSAADLHTFLSARPWALYVPGCFTVDGAFTDILWVEVTNSETLKDTREDQFLIRAAPSALNVKCMQSNCSFAASRSLFDNGNNDWLPGMEGGLSVRTSTPLDQMGWGYFETATTYDLEIAGDTIESGRELEQDIGFLRMTFHGGIPVHGSEARGSIVFTRSMSTEKHDRIVDVMEPKLFPLHTCLCTKAAFTGREEPILSLSRAAVQAWISAGGPLKAQRIP